MLAASTEIIGFDLGHGESALAKVSVDKDPTPKMLEIGGRKTQITAVAWDSAGSVVVGEEAIVLPTATRFEICFKRRPTSEQGYRETMQAFVGAVFRHLRDSTQISEGDGVRVLVGCPSGWSEAERHAYADLLRGDHLPSLEVVPESFAAMVNAKESGEVTKDQLREPVLVIDIGSSTTDFTLVRGSDREPLKNFGEDLGGAQIDQAILSLMFAQQENRGAIESLLAQHPIYRRRCELRCRKAKEKYFSNPELYREQPVVEAEKIQKGFYFEVELDERTIEAALGQPLSALNGRSWRQAFREAVSKASDEVGRQGRQVGVVLLTGGASRMDFVRAICAEFFPGSLCKRGGEPEFAIADGLARWGRVHLRTMEFQKEINRVIESDIPKLVAKHAAAFRAHIAGPLTDGLIEHMMKRGMRDWRDRRIITLRGLSDHMKGLATAWLESSAAAQAIARATADWAGPIIRDIAALINPICRRYHISQEAMTISLGHSFRHGDVGGFGIGDPTAIDDLTAIAGIIAVAVIAMIAGGAGTALIMAGPIGLIIGAVLGVFIVGFGVEAAEKKIQTADIPGWVRKKVLSDARIGKTCADKRTELEGKVQEMLANDKSLENRLVASLTEGLRKQLREKLEDASLLLA